MCGIFCAVSFEKQFNEIDYNRFITATNSVAYRGPDSYGYKKYSTSENLTSDGVFNVFFGHRRLSIIDLSEEGNQPMQSGNLHIIFNGEIFNYLELREELKSKGVHFKTNSDTEVILKVYENFGSKGFSKLNGMWALIILDLKNKLIIASRDRFSIKPLYWYKDINKIYFSSEIKQIIPFLSKKELNIRAMSRFLHQGIIDMDTETFYNNIMSLPSKCNLLINLKTKEIKSEVYWEYSHTNISSNDVYEQFRELFTDSIKIRLRSDVEVGALLSGGLDSSAISVISKKLIGESFKTYTVVSENKKYSEEKFVDLLVKEKYLRNEKLFIGNDDISKNFQNVIHHQDEPFLNFIVVAHYTILQKIKNETDITVVLNGQGGDEVLAGYLRFYFFNLKHLLDEKKYFYIVKEILGSLFNRTILMQWSNAGAKRYIPYLSKNEKQFILVKQERENTSNFKNLIEAQIANIDKYSVPTINKYEDRNSMAHSLEVRLPFLDHRLVEFLLNIENDMKIKNGWNKYILRKSITDLPKEIRWRKDKKGFVLPEADWIKKDFKQDILSCFKKSRLEQFGIIRGDYFLEKYNSYLNGNNSIHNIEISRVYIAEKWMRHYFN